MATSSATASQAFKAALVAAIRGLVDESQTLVTFGHPGTASLNFPSAVAVTDVEATQSPATLGTNRSREEILSAVVQIAAFRPGGLEVEEEASDAAYALLEAIERHVRVTDTTLGGVVRHCVLDSHRSAGATRPQDLIKGRTIEIEATFVAAVRITG